MIKNGTMRKMAVWPSKFSVTEDTAIMVRHASVKGDLTSISFGNNFLNNDFAAIKNTMAPTTPVSSRILK
jgi:hypothetical protein